MQQRRYRPGDVLDDYCPRERRITDHAIVAMIDDNIKQTRCVVCDAEHEYKDGKVPAQRRKKPQAALFAEVLEGLQPPQPAARVAPHPPSPDVIETPEVMVDEVPPVATVPLVAPPVVTDLAAREAGPPPAAVARVEHLDAMPGVEEPPRDEGPVRRQLIRAALPRPEGQPPQPSRAIPEFTIRQTKHRGPRHGRRRGGGGQAQGFGAGPGATRFSRNGGQGRSRRRRGKKG